VACFPSQPDPRRDEGQQAVDQPPLKGDDLRQGEREPVAGMAAKMKGQGHYERHPDIDVSAAVKDLVVM